MTKDQPDVVVGYELRNLYTSEQNQELVLDSEATEASEDSEGGREINFSWDWRIPNLPEDVELGDDSSGPQAVWFDVAVGVRVGPSEDDPNRYGVTLVGGFVVPFDEPSIPVHRFAKLNAVALLFPYLRQCVSDLSERAAEEPFWLPIVNVAQLMDGFELESSQGWKSLQAHPKLAMRLGIPEEDLTSETPEAD